MSHALGVRAVEAGELKRIARDVAWALACSTGIPRVMRRRHRREILILMYHAIVDESVPFTRWTHLELSRFEWQIRYLKSRYRILPLREVLGAMCNGGGLPDHAAVITFDDGFHSIYSRAFPVLCRERVPATVFLTTGFVGSCRFTWTSRIFLALRSTAHTRMDLSAFGLPEFRLDGVAECDAASDWLRSHVKRLPAAEKEAILDAIDSQLEITPDDYPGYAREFSALSWTEVAEMFESGLVDFGAHGASHEILSRLPQDQMRREILESCGEVSRRIGNRQALFAYPNGERGDFNEDTKSMLREAGALCGLSTIEGLCAHGDDRFELKRIGVGNDVSKARFAALCSGLESSSKRRLGRL